MKAQLSIALFPALWRAMSSRFATWQILWGGQQGRMVQLPATPQVVSLLPVPAAIGESKVIIRVCILILFHFYFIYALLFLKTSGARWNMEHGHRTSKDLVHWINSLPSRHKVKQALLHRFLNCNKKIVLYSIFCIRLFPVKAIDFIRSFFGF